MRKMVCLKFLHIFSVLYYSFKFMRENRHSFHFREKCQHDLGTVQRVKRQSIRSVLT